MAQSDCFFLVSKKTGVVFKTIILLINNKLNIP